MCMKNNMMFEYTKYWYNIVYVIPVQYILLTGNVVFILVCYTWHIAKMLWSQVAVALRQNKWHQCQEFADNNINVCIPTCTQILTLQSTDRE